MVRARVCLSGGGEIEGRTQNLSSVGVLVAISGFAPAIGQDVIFSVVHPMSGEERAISGKIARHDRDQTGQVRGLGIHFSIDLAQVDETINDLNQVKASQHARRLGGTTGSIDTLGLNDLLMSFGQRFPRGRFTLMRGG
ncbi:MAG: PilZ domain-containing protein [bacterium]|nr:PilZ domain-containing protein [bacterium]